MCISDTDSLKDELRLDLSKLGAEEQQAPVFAVPHTKQEVEPVIDSATDVFWELRRYGESWDGVTEPPEKFLSEGVETAETEEGKKPELEEKSNKVCIIFLV